MTQLTLAAIRDPECTRCKLQQSANKICELGKSVSSKAEIIVVSKMSNSEAWQSELNNFLTEAGLDVSKIYFTQAIKCRTFDQTPSNADVKACRLYLEQEVAFFKPKWILALGNEALLATTGKSGITKYRGKVWPGPGGVDVVATLSPSSVKRNPGQLKGFIADLKLFASKVKGVSVGIEPPVYKVINNKTDLKWLHEILSKTKELNFDVETVNDYYNTDGRIISLSGTCVLEDSTIQVFALPLYHPQSPWKRNHRAVLRFLKDPLERIPKVVAHNGGYDSKWMIIYGVNLKCTFDTMIAIHLLNENIQKGLKPQAQIRLGVEPWGVDTSNLLNMELNEVLEYNVLDTWYMYHIKLQLIEELKAQPRLARVFAKLMMPALQNLVDSEMRGIYIDVDRLNERAPIVEDTLFSIEEAIRIEADLQCEKNPLGLKPEDPDWPKDAKGKAREFNLNASIFARWLLFDWLGLPVINRGKEKADGSPGDPSMAEDVLLHLKTVHPVVPFMLERVKWQKYKSSFITPYQELYDEDHRIHTNFKLTGTVTGRLSSGKPDMEKISGFRGKMRGVNLQQVPRDPFIRGLFGAPPGWTFIEADYSQIELRIAAYLAREAHMLHLYAIGADIHLTTAARVTGLPESQVTKKIRKEVGKPVNFGFLYGMGWRKFIETAFNNYGAVFSEDEARAARSTYFQLFPQLTAWHARQRRLAHAHGKVQSPLGRIRHLPDIYSPEQGIVAEAERQAINSPVQGFASDLAVLSMNAIIEKIKEAGLPAICVGLVHDAINFEVRNDAVAEVLPIVKSTMEDMSIVRKKFGVHIDVPIIADLQVGRSWGETRELTEEQVYDYKPEYGEPLSN